jgi:hypothetical protein
MCRLYASHPSACTKVWKAPRRSILPVGSFHQPEVGMNTRTIAIIAFVIAVIVLIVLLA